MFSSPEAALRFAFRMRGKAIISSPSGVFTSKEKMKVRNENSLTAYDFHAQAGMIFGKIDRMPQDQQLWIYYTYGETGEFERIARSSLTRGAAVMTDAELVLLAEALRAIHERFVSDPWDHAHAMDVEFILHGPRRELVVVQARPYTLRYDQGREMAVEP